MDTGFMGKRDLLTVIILDLCGGIAVSKDPFLEFFTCPPDRLPINIAIPLVAVPLIVPVDKINVIGGIESPVGNNDRPGIGEILSLLNRLQNDT